jgi:hypothetical protein
VDIAAIAQVIYDSSLAVSIRQVEILFPALESLHVIGVALVVGTIALVDLRLLGVASHRRSVNRLIREVTPYTWVAFVVAVATGLLMFASKSIDYVQISVFFYKMIVLLLAGLNMAVFHLGVYRRIGEWDEALPPPLAARIAGFSSLTLWTAAIGLGRWIGFV